MRRFEIDPGCVFLLLIFPAGIVIVSPVLFILEALHVRAAMNWMLVCYFYLLPAYVYWRHKNFQRIDGCAAWGLPFLWGCFGTLVLLFTLPGRLFNGIGAALSWTWEHVLQYVVLYGLGIAMIVGAIAVVVSIINSAKRSF